MDVIATAYITVIFLGFAIVLMLGVYSLRFEKFPGGRYFLIYIALGFVAILSFGFLSISHTPEQTFLWARLRFIGFAYSPAVFLLFVWDYTGKQFPYQRLLARVIFIVPTLTQIVLWSDAVTPLFFTEWSTRTYSFLTVEYSRFGLWFQVHSLHTWMVLIVAYYFVIASLTSSKKSQRPGVLWMLAGNLVVTIVASIPATTGNVSPLNLTPISITLGLMVSGWGLFRHRLFDLLTAAYHTVFESLQDAVIVLNSSREIVQWNAAAQNLLASSGATLMYRSIDRVLADAGLNQPLPTSVEAGYEVTVHDKIYDVRLSLLQMSNGYMGGQILQFRDVTDYRCAERAHRESDKLYRLLADNSSDMIALNRLDGRFLYVSPSGLALTGYTEAELLSMPAERVTDLIHPEDRAMSSGNFLNLLTGEGPVSWESRYLRKDATYYWAEVSAKIIVDADGQPTHLMSVFHNIDARKQVEAALRDSNQRYDTLVTNLPAMVYQLHRSPQGEYRFNYVSPNATRFFGVDAEAIIADPRTLFGQMEPAAYAGLLAAQEVSARDLTQFVWEWGFGAAGQVRWHHIESMPTRLEDGTVIWNGVELDITAQKQAEFALERTRKMLEQITHMLPDIIHVFDVVDVKFIYSNRTIHDLLGYDEAEVSPQRQGRSYYAPLMHPDDYATLPEWRERYAQLADGAIIESEARWMHKERGVIWLNTREMVYERTPDGQVRQILGTMRDVTERKQAEEQRQQLLARLEAANQELKDFAYVISHDLRAPLRGVSSIAHWLLTEYGERFDDESQELLNLLAGRVRRMEQMINGVLEYSRIGRETSITSRVDVHQIVTQVIQDIVPVERIHVRVETPLPTVRGDATRIRQVFQNLIDNGVKFMDKPKGEICIRCQRDATMWRFDIQDNGPGIAPEHFERVFQLFQTLNPKDKFESTGVGLALTKRIIEMYNGKIWLESQEHHGTTFHFTLPIA